MLSRTKAQGNERRNGQSAGGQLHACTAAHPCPVCGGIDRCSVGDSGIVLCNNHDGDQPGWRFTGRSKCGTWAKYWPADDAPRSQATAKPKPAIDWSAKADSFARALTPELAAELADALGLPLWALDALPIGWCADDRNGPYWTIAEVNADGIVVGINRRYRDGTKKAMPGSARGLILPREWQEAPGPIPLVEGASDVLAAAAMGVTAIGRPSVSGGRAELAALLKADDREFVVLGEFDPKPNGDWPGRDAALSVAADLSKALGRPVKVAFAPNGAKDTRRWLNDQKADLADTTALRSLGVNFVAAVVKSARLPQVAVPQFTTANPTNPEPLPGPISLRELIARYPAIRPPIVDGLVRQGETANIIAASKTGKSWLTYTLAISVATGTKWLDTFATAAGKVLIIDNELHSTTIASRVPRVAAALGVPYADVVDRVDVWALRGQLRSLPELAAELEALPRGHYRLIIVDASYRAMPAGLDENSNLGMTAIYNLIDRLAETTGATFILIHHASKGSQTDKAVTDVGSGAGAQSRAADAHIVLRPHEEESAVVFEAAVRSFPPVAPLCLRWAYPVWQPATDLDPTLLRRPKPRTRKEDDSKPSPINWTARLFAERFCTREPQTRHAVLEAARTAGLSDNKAETLLRAAIGCGFLFDWKTAGAASPTMISSAPVRAKQRSTQEK